MRVLALAVVLSLASCVSSVPLENKLYKFTDGNPSVDVASPQFLVKRQDEEGEEGDHPDEAAEAAAEAHYDVPGTALCLEGVCLTVEDFLRVKRMPQKIATNLLDLGYAFF